MTHKLLARQIKRLLGAADETQLANLLSELEQLSQHESCTPAGRKALTGMRSFLEQVDEAYLQADRDIDISKRSLELSSTELTQANENLRQEADSRAQVLLTLRRTANEVLSRLGKHLAEGESLENLSVMLSGLVTELLSTRQDLESALDAVRNQQFALDQHAIVSVADAKGDIIYANDKFCSISQYRREELIGKNHRVINSGRHEREFFADMWNTITLGAVWHGEICNRARDGSEYWVYATIVPVMNQRAKAYEYISIRTDITDRKAFERALIKAKQEAEEANQAKSNFLATMSHEIRTPMNGIIGMTELALDTRLDSEQREYLEVVKGSSHALLDIINDILDFSKIESGKVQLETIEFLFRELIAITLKSLSLRAEQKGLELVYQIDSGIPEMLLGDPGRLRQVITNLIGNAIKFSNVGDIIFEAKMVQTEGLRAAIYFAISDHGIGISEDKQHSIFEAFSQADASTTRRYGGTGLGLTISSRLVEAMGGKLEVRSKEGEGSTFYFTIPFGIVEKEREQEPPSRLHDVSVLVVDDNAVNRRFFSDTLRKWGLNPDTADSALAGYNLIEQKQKDGKPYQLLLLDACMPETDGFELATQLQKDQLFSGAQMIMLSSSGSRGDAQHCRDLGIANYISKPVSQSELLSGIEQTLNGVLDAREKINDATEELDLHVPLNPLHILVAEDNPVNQKLMSALLDKWGYRYEIVDTGLSALEHFEKHHYDLILMDMQMPVMGGVEATQRIRALERKNNLDPIPIAAMTANVMEGDREKCIEAGMDYYLSKPVNAKKLRDLISDQLPRLKTNAVAADPLLADTVPAKHAGDGFDYRKALDEGDMEILLIITRPFLLDCDRQMREIEAAIRSNNAEQLYRSAHTLKGLVGNFFAEPVEEIAKVLEQKGKHANFDDAERFYAQMQAEMEKLKIGLKQFLSQHEAG